jgi:hypothetical protein
MSHDKPKQSPSIPRSCAPHPDEVIHVPKGSSKARFLMTFLLVILVLTTFSVTGPLTSRRARQVVRDVHALEDAGR